MNHPKPKKYKKKMQVMLIILNPSNAQKRSK